MGTEKQHKVVGTRFVVRNVFLVGKTWYGRVRDLETRKMWKVSTRERNKRKAEQFLIKWAEDRLKKEKRISVAPILFAKAIEEYLSLKTLRPSTLGEYNACFNGVYLPEFEGKYVYEIAIGDIEHFLKKMESVRKQSSRTRQKHLTNLRSFFRWARRRRYTLEDPTEGLRVPRGAKRIGIALSHEEARRLLEACRTPVILKLSAFRNAGGRNGGKLTERPTNFQQTFNPSSYLFLAVIIALHTGLRRGNITGLKWRHIDFGKGHIRIPAEEMKANADHVVPIHPELLEAFKERLKELGKCDTEAPVLGKEITSLKRSFPWALKHAGLPYQGDRKIRFHDLRHTVSTWLAVRYPQAIKDAILGHAPRGVSGLYTHVPFEELKKAIDSMPRLLTPPVEVSQALGAP